MLNTKLSQNLLLEIKKYVLQKYCIKTKIQKALLFFVFHYMKITIHSFWFFNIYQAYIFYCESLLDVNLCSFIQKLYFFTAALL